MSHINLLPWRQLIREKGRMRCRLYLLTGVLSASMILILIDFYATQRVHYQLANNSGLDREILQLDIQIKANSKLISKISAVQQLQSKRTSIVFFLNSLTSIIPDGVVLTQVEQRKNDITLLGYSASASDISILMHNIEQSPWIKSSDFPEINKKGMKNKFKLHFILDWTLDKRT